MKIVNVFLGQKLGKTLNSFKTEEDFAPALGMHHAQGNSRFPCTLKIIFAAEIDETL